MNKAAQVAVIEDDPHRALVLDAADDVFARRGFRQTSMDDIARAAGVSRACLAFHFSCKEQVFAAAVDRALKTFRGLISPILQRPGLPVEVRVLDAFCTANTTAIGSSILIDLVAACDELVAPLVKAFEQDFATEVAETLAIAGIPARWAVEGLTADDLAAHLVIVSVGLIHKSADPVDYRARMAAAIRLVCRTPKPVH
jgi:AcrR family transcriptional regulator